MYSNGQGFYLTLPSESSKGLFPENNASEYSVRLPRWIHLKGEWEIGLHSIAYTRRNIIHHLDGTILYGYPEHDGTTTLATTGKMQKHYSSVGEYARLAFLHAKLQIQNEPIFFATVSHFLELGNEFNS